MVGEEGRWGEGRRKGVGKGDGQALTLQISLCAPCCSALQAHPT